MDAWVRRYSQAVGPDLGAYFELFAIPAGGETRRLLADWEPWMPEDGFIARFVAEHQDG